MAAAQLAELAVGIFGLVKGSDIGFAFGDPHAVGLPQAEGIDRRGRPGLAVVAMTVSRKHRLARRLQLDGAAKAAGLVGGGGCLLLFGMRQQVIVFRMLRHVVPDEVAFDLEFASLGPHGVEGRTPELRAYSPSAQFRRHFGMHQRDRAG
jgi:hypothetical protein